MNAWTRLSLGLWIGSLSFAGFGATNTAKVWPTPRSKATPVKLTRGPYLQSGSTNGMVVRWRTDAPCSSWVIYGMETNKTQFVADSPGIGIDHIVLLTELKTNTKYFYSVSGGTNYALNGNGTNAFFMTSPLHDSPQPIRVWVLGDPGTRRLGQFWVRDAYYNLTGLRHTDLCLLLGDNAYNDGRDQEFQDNFFPVYADLLRKTVCWPTYGNHDSYSANSLTQSGAYYDIFTLPTLGQCGGVMSGTEAYFSFDYGNTHFISLNSSDVDRSLKGRMLNWLRSDLAANHCDWTIAYWHHPPYSKGEHDSDKEALSDPRLTEMRMNALPILEAGGVDLVLCGHSHTYERSFLLDGHYGPSTTLSPAMKKDAGDGRSNGSGAYHKPSRGPAPHEGAVYVVAGSSGHLSGGKLNHPAMVYSAYSLGSLILDIEGPKLNVTFIDDRGAKLDYFTMVKGEPEQAQTSR